MFKTSLFIFILFIGNIAQATELNIYSARKSQLIAPLTNAFTKDTGIKVNLLTSTDGALIKRLATEGKNSPADLLLLADAGRLSRVAIMGLFQPVQSARLKQSIPANLRDPQNLWFGLTMRTRPVFYNKAAVKPSELSTYEALTGVQWKGRVCIQSSNHIYNQSLVASMIVSQGANQTLKWVRGLVKNFARNPKGGEKDQILAVASGQCDVAIANSYYYAQMLFGGDSRMSNAAKKVGVFWPNQKDRGVHINLSGAGVVKYAKHKENAVRFLEYMINDDAQRWYSTVNGEYPVKKGVPMDRRMKAWGNFKSDGINVSLLGKHNATAVKLMDQAGWK